MSWLRITELVALALNVAMVVRIVQRRGWRIAIRILLESYARVALPVGVAVAASAIWGRSSAWLVLPLIGATAWFGETPLGMLNLLLLQWFGVRLARHVQVGRVPCQCRCCGEMVMYDPELSVNLNCVGGCQGNPDQLHTGEIFDGTPRHWRLLRWVWPLTGWWSGCHWIARRS